MKKIWQGILVSLSGFPVEKRKKKIMAIAKLFALHAKANSNIIFVSKYRSNYLSLSQIINSKIYTTLLSQRFTLLNENSPTECKYTRYKLRWQR